MLQVGHTTNVSFNVNVQGTSTEPVVRLVLGTTPELTFTASRGANDEFGAEVTIPSFVDAGAYDLRVEVLLNNRVFTPVRKKVDVLSAKVGTPETPVLTKDEEVPAEVVSEKPPLSAPLAAPIRPQLNRRPSGTSLLKSLEPPRTPQVPHVPHLNPAPLEPTPRVEAAQETVSAPLVEAPISELMPPAAPMRKLRKASIAPEPRRRAPKAPLRVTIGEMNALLPEAQPSSPTTSAPAQRRTPIRLIKESLFYE